MGKYCQKQTKNNPVFTAGEGFSFAAIDVGSDLKYPILRHERQLMHIKKIFLQIKREAIINPDLIIFSGDKKEEGKHLAFIHYFKCSNPH